jgi:hypothetical protein
MLMNILISDYGKCCCVKGRYSHIRQSGDKKSAKYSVHINYKIKKIPEKGSSLPDTNSLLLVFSNSYDSNNIKIYVNDTIYKDCIINTNRSTELAYAKKIQKINQIKSIGIQVDNGPIAHVLIKPHAYIMEVEYYRDTRKLYILFSDRYPMLD